MCSPVFPWWSIRDVFGVEEKQKTAPSLIERWWRSWGDNQLKRDRHGMEHDSSALISTLISNRPRGPPFGNWSSSLSQHEEKKSGDILLFLSFGQLWTRLSPKRVVWISCPSLCPFALTINWWSSSIGSEQMVNKPPPFYLNFLQVLSSRVVFDLFDWQMDCRLPKAI